MFENVEMLSIGTAAVVDTALLLSILERKNRQVVALWMVWLALAAWLWHVGTFVHRLGIASDDALATGVHWLTMTMMAGGLLLMPSALLHGVVRLYRTGLAGHARTQVVYALLYLPLAAVVPVSAALARDPLAGFLELTAPFVVPYVVWVAGVNVFAATMFLRLRRTLELPHGPRFFTLAAGVLLGMTAVLVFVTFYALDTWPALGPQWQLIVVLLPAAPAVLFAYFVVRHRFAGLLIERTLVYGAIVTGLLLVHRVLLRDVTARLEDRYRIDFAILEGMAAIALILLYQPLRRRFAEGLRYLMGSSVADVRREMRRLAVEMSELAGQPPADLLTWVTDSLRETLRVKYVAGWLFEGAGQVSARAGDTGRMNDEQAVRLYRQLSSGAIRFCTRYDAPTRADAERLGEAEASLVVVIGHREISGLLLVGCQTLSQQPSDEEISSLIVLVEQLGSTMSNSMLQAERLAAERSALQNEKLSTLGLLAGSIAHELKNPLSSIKTIATVTAEQLGPDHENAEDLQLILGEIDRLANSTSQLLTFARPAAGSGGEGSVSAALGCTLAVMRHLATERQVSLEVQIAEPLPEVSADESAMQEIFFNLLSNSVDAAGPDGTVAVSCCRQDGCVVAEFHDTGPGILPEVQDRLFEPFFTTKASGTGLGLYIVGRRVSEFGGEIRCETGPDRGTRFIVKFPLRERR